MMKKEEVIAWLKTLPEDSYVGVDDTGMALRTVDDPLPFLEIGGLPE